MNEIVQPIKLNKVVKGAWEITCPRCNGPQPGHVLRTGKRGSDGIMIRMLECPEKPIERPKE